MKKQNIDGISRPKKYTSNPIVKSVIIKPKAQTVFLDNRAAVLSVPYKHPGQVFFEYAKGTMPRGTRAVLTALTLILAFGSGMWFATFTPRTEADSGQAKVQEPSAGAAAQSPPALEVVSNDALFNTPLVLLKDYISEVANAPDAMAIRKAKLKEFLKVRNSPLENQSELIAEQEHWKLILAISFAESTLGKRCYMNNCSGIGGSNIRQYRSVEAWVLDFNRLLEKKYKDKTLEQMCGVYVQPCNPNWLLATKQMLASLDEAKIE